MSLGWRLAFGSKFSSALDFARIGWLSFISKLKLSSFSVPVSNFDMRLNARASSKEKSLNLGVDGLLQEWQLLSEFPKKISVPESESEEENKLESSESLF